MEYAHPCTSLISGSFRNRRYFSRLQTQGVVIKKTKKPEVISIQDIKPAEYNPRFMTDQARTGLAKSISAFGNISEITWNKKTGNLVTGHQRWHDLNVRFKDLSLNPIGDDRLEIVSKKSGQTGFYIRVVDWDDATERAANVAANNKHIQGEFDEEALQEMLAAIKTDLDPDMFEQLQFNSLVLAEWLSDISVVQKTKENLDGILSKIIIECPQEKKDDISKIVKDALVQSNIEGITIR